MTTEGDSGNEGSDSDMIRVLYESISQKDAIIEGLRDELARERQARIDLQNLLSTTTTFVPWREPASLPERNKQPPQAAVPAALLALVDRPNQPTALEAHTPAAKKRNRESHPKLETLNNTKPAVKRPNPSTKPFEYGIKLEDYKAEQNQRWEMMYQTLKEYKEEHGHLRVTEQENKKLHFWMKTQRAYFRNAVQNKESATLAPERVAKLQVLQFEWAIQEKDKLESWERRFRELLSYKAVNGDCRVPKEFKGNLALGTWVYGQRRNYRDMLAGKSRKGLSDERIQRLEEVGFEWKVRER